MKKSITLLVLLICFQSCQYFEKNVPNKDELLKEELQKVNWAEVDEFPSTTSCDSIEDKEARKQCFFDYLTQTIQGKLATDTLQILYPNLDTIQVKVTVYPDAKLKFEPYFPKDNMAYDTDKIDSIMQTKLADFPIIEPAIKRGIKVKSQFVIPVILKSE
jgi:hypothetical protein